MKKPHIFLLLLITSVTMQSCGIFCKLTSNVSLKEAYVESGYFKDSVTFESTGAFVSIDSVIGMIDTTTCATPNSYLDETGWVYVFEGGAIPHNILRDSKYRRSIALKTANWQDDKVYKLPYDAEICVVPRIFKIYLREKGDYQRQKAFVYGTTVYRFKNRYVIEDYGGLLTYHEYLRPNASPPNLFTALNLSSTDYQATFNGTAFNGLIDYNTIPYTPAGTTDKIRFNKSFGSNGVSYRLRHVYIKHQPDTIAKYFNGDRVKSQFGRSQERNNKRMNPWFIYLNGLFSSYLEPVIKGYQCTNCTGNIVSRSIPNGLDSPPLPVNGNGN